MFQLINNKRKGKLSQLWDITKTISTSRDMKGLLEFTLNKTLKALCSERGSIFLTGDDGQELFLKLAYNLNANLGEISEIKRKMGEGVIGRVAKDRKPLLVKDIRHDERFKISNMYNNYKTNSFLCVPIATDVKLIGVISITENKHKRPYSEEDLRFLKIIADHIALKIEKSQLLSEIEKFKKKMKTDTKFIDLGKFSSGISHELNSPLDGVIRYVNLALRSIEEGSAKEYLLEAKGGLTRIAGIIRSLQELVMRKKVSQSRPIGVNKVIEGCIDALRYQAIYKGIEIKNYFCLDLPEIPDLGLESVFSNILKNALDALPDKGCIDIHTSLEKDFIKVTISDTGCGIPKDNINNIFEPFFTTKGITEGYGLGLSICYDIVKRYNGRIDVLSEPDKGTKFVIHIPCGGKK